MDFAELLNSEISKKKQEFVASHTHTQSKAQNTDNHDNNDDNKRQKVTTTTDTFSGKRKLLLDLDGQQRNAKDGYIEENDRKMQKVLAEVAAVETEHESDDGDKTKPNNEQDSDEPGNTKAHTAAKGSPDTELKQEQQNSILAQTDEQLVDTQSESQCELKPTQAKTDTTSITPSTSVEGLIIDAQEIATNKPKVYAQDRSFIMHILSKWESKIHNDYNHKHHSQAQFDSDNDILTETKKQLVPLLVQLRKQKLPENMYPSVSTIMHYIQQNNFKLANETYLKLSIGNVAWPIGVIGVGIHARKAQEKITGEKNVANIMINEKTRKWITAVKRLITFCENNQELI